MGIVSTVQGWFKREARSNSDDFWYTPLTVWSLSSAGLDITPENAIKVSSIWACTKVISETIAGLPWIVYERTAEGGKDRAFDTPMYRLLHDAPNNFQTSFEFREFMQYHLCLRGNAYAYIDRNFYGEPLRLLPIHPSRVTVEQGDDYELRYKVKEGDTDEKVYLQKNILHLKAMSSDGLTGISPVFAGSDSLGLAMAAENFASAFFKNGAAAGHVLMHPATLGETAHKHLRQSLSNEHGGVFNAGKPIILEEGMKYEAMGVPHKDAQFLETRQHQIEEVCRWFRMPPHKVAHLLRSTFTNIEHQALEFVSDTILPWLKRWEQRCQFSLFKDSRYFSEFLVDGLLRGDVETRTNALATQFQNGALTQNEWRAIENRNPIPQEFGDKHYVAMNLTPVDRVGQVEETAQGEAVESPRAVSEETGIQAVDRPLEYIEPFVRDIAECLASAEIREVEKKIAHDSFVNTSVAYYGKHNDYIEKKLKPLEVAIGKPINISLSRLTMQDYLQGEDRRDQFNDLKGFLPDQIYTELMGVIHEVSQDN